MENRKVLAEHRPGRRDVLKKIGVAGGIGVTGLAGCVSDVDDAEDNNQDDNVDDGSAGDGDSSEGGETNDGGLDFDTVQIAFLEPMTGDFAALAEERHRGEQLGVKSVNESDEFDFEFEWDLYDTQLNPEDGVSAARNAIERQGADFISGAISSSVALAINKVAAQEKVIYTPGAADVSITGSNCNEYVFRFETNTAQIAEVVANWTAENLGGRIMYSVADYAYGHSVKTEFEKRIQGLADDYEDVLTVTPDLGATDFEAYITQIQNKAEDADALLVGATGGHLVRFLVQATERGLKEDIPIVTSTGSFFVIRAGAKQAAYDVYSGTRYVPGLDTGTNPEFVEAYQAEFDALPDNFSRVGYESVRMVARGIQAAGSRDPDVVKDVLPGMTHETIFGDVEFRKGDNQATNPVWMGKNVAPAEGEIADVEILDELSGDEAIPPLEDVDCEM